jgi:electron transfer flavoprotein alpha subunit
MAVLALVEQDAGAVDELSLQALALARELGEPLHALIVGAAAAATGGPADANGSAAALGAHGVQTAHVAQGERLAAYAPGAWAACLEQLIDRIQPSAVVAAGTNRGNEVLGHLAARRDVPFAANCIAAGADGTVTRVRWGGSLLEEARIDSDLKVLSVAPHMVEATTRGGGTASVERFEPELGEELVRVVEHTEAPSAGISLDAAKVVVSGGRGVGSADGFGILEELAGLLNAAVGCSRVVTMAGWRPHTDQVGQTGTKVAPDLYIACGISGATQHIAGCKGAKKILAINSDAEAPILASADYAVIGDLAEIVPAITAELRKAQSS